ncbi:MAG: hypothetical protein JXB36_18750 [Gammaproteobacteria bacterium]|nr:hypothetical protein [Gammaproteobacteria bacterium]
MLPKPDPRSPGMVRDMPVTLTVCYVEGDDAHANVGDRVEFDTNRLGRLRIRHLPGPNNETGAWNDGDYVRVRSAVLVERVDPRGNRANSRRFVPVGRFKVGVGEHSSRLPFDFLASMATDHLTVEGLPECNADIGDDEVLIRGGGDGNDRHGGHIIAR